MKTIFLNTVLTIAVIVCCIQALKFASVNNLLRGMIHAGTALFCVWALLYKPKKTWNLS